MIKGFLNSPSLKTLCVVSCCYHLTEECLTKNCKFTKNARMLAQQSVERVSKKSEPYSPSLFYRSLLQVLFQSLGKNVIFTTIIYIIERLSKILWPMYLHDKMGFYG